MTYTVSDWIADFLVYKGTSYIFYVSGGGAMFLIDAFGRSSNLSLISNHHEQASAMCAEAFFRINRQPGVCLATTGPAATNIITGLLCAWTDSIPTLYLTGQAKSTSLIGNTGMRQRGVHEVDISSMVRHCTKYTSLLTSVDDLITTFNLAWNEMLSGRPGPSHIDIPLDIQSSPFEVFQPFHVYDSSINTTSLLPLDPHDISQITSEVISRIHNSRFPIVLAGYGVFLSNSIPLLDSFCSTFSIPIVSTKNLYGHLSEVSSLHLGHVGTYGSRSANLALQSADLIVILGSRLPQPVTGYDPAQFGISAQKIYYFDIDPLELSNAQINCVKTKVNLDILLNYLVQFSPLESYQNSWDSRIQKINTICSQYDLYPEDDSGFLNPYTLIEHVISTAPSNSIFVYDQGASYYCSTLSNNLKSGQLMFSNGGFTPMGYGLPAAIGAWYASNCSRPIICVHGDGGLQMNVQELQTLSTYNIPIKIFVYSNDGYLSIKNTQDSYFESRYFGSNASSGLSCPSFASVAKSYKLDSLLLSSFSDLKDALPSILLSPRPTLIECLTNPHQAIYPRVASTVNPDGSMSSDALHNMSPRLPEHILSSLFKPLHDQ